MEQLYARWILRHWVPQCLPKCQELRTLYAVVWRVPVTGDVNISTTCQLSQIRVNSTTTDRPISTSRQTVDTTTCQVSKIYHILRESLLFYYLQNNRIFITLPQWDNRLKGHPASKGNVTPGDRWRKMRHRNPRMDFRRNPRRDFRKLGDKV